MRSIKINITCMLGSGAKQFSVTTYISLDYLTLIRLMSSCMRQRFPLYHVYVELKSTRYFAVFYDEFSLAPAT